MYITMHGSENVKSGGSLFVSSLTQNP